LSENQAENEFYSSHPCENQLGESKSNLKKRKKRETRMGEPESDFFIKRKRESNEFFT
jgi:hypothetical protein